ncbi:hypothetical protein ABE28_024090 (plasmid) [Peribacillus muralis]|uniref:Uncharacterized protein n=1 Tax=Peribacillus muralis TaxID=264697 RepID=A0A1B3XW67_9BACI|nr:hypothetical protein [Peribacillus muralis]AOH57431.1 hypothetical protein ABE28_024090 [Peribacillus muralis]
MGLLIVYATGLLIGVALVTLSSFLKELDHKKRSIFVAVIGVFAVIGGLVIGGFEGMPISIIGIGILTVPILLLFAGNKSMIRNMVFAIVVLVPLAVFIYAGVDKIFGDNFIVVAKNENLDTYLKQYYEELQVKTDKQGFKRLEPNNGEKVIVLSLGKEKQGNNIEVTGIEKQGDRTLINVKSFYNQSTE